MTEIGGLLVRAHSGPLSLTGRRPFSARTMSIPAYEKAWETKCPPVSKLVLLALADRADKSGFCWPSINDIKTRTGLAKRSVLNHVAILETRGVLRVYREHRKSNRYRIMGIVSNVAGAPRAPKVVHGVHQGGASRAPQSSVNRKLNHQGSLPVKKVDFSESVDRQARSAKEILAGMNLRTVPPGA